jgi:Nucleotide modification associated domain 3
MKIIFSRKGFDTESGKVPSPILNHGPLYSFPIPSRSAELRPGLQRVCYDGIKCGDVSMGTLVDSLAKGHVVGSDEVHHDPDLDYSSLHRDKGWRPIFGQSGGAETQLRRAGVDSGDVFLFFGMFRHVEGAEGGYRYVRGSDRVHVLFGWLQIEERLSVDDAAARLPWAQQHPHLCRRSAEPNDTVYLATKHLVIGGRDTGLPGGGVFDSFRDELVLTAPGRTMSWWMMPGWFRPLRDGHECLTMHSNPKRWGFREDHVLLETVARGQEFVFDTSGYPSAEGWLSSIITGDGSHLMAPSAPTERPRRDPVHGEVRGSQPDTTQRRSALGTTELGVEGSGVKVRFKVTESYRRSGYLFVKNVLRGHFPEPEAELTLLLPGIVEPQTIELKRYSKDRWRIVGLGWWFESHGVRADDHLEFEIVWPNRVYRVHHVPKSSISNK